MTSYEDQGAGYDPGAAGHELQGRRSSPEPLGVMITQIDGWWWPAVDLHARGVITRDCAEAVGRMLALIPGRDLIVQAGANVGVYPIALADHFQAVVTFEPDPTNWECLERNLAARDSLCRVNPFRAALGEAAGWCIPTPVEVANCGAHRVEFAADGPVGVVTIDSLNLPVCDAIWLDIEGPEFLALKGAEATIAKFSPLIGFEGKGLGATYGIAPGQANGWLEAQGYTFAERIGNDSIFRKNP